MLQKLWVVYRDEDATLVEVNPLVRTEDGSIVALDGKVTLDANADFRQAEHEALEDKDAADPLEAKAEALNLNYVKLDGSVGIIGNGAGLVMSTLDVVAYAGEQFGGQKPANFLRHRWWRVGGRHGERPRRHPQRPPGEVGVRQRVRRHHLLHRGDDQRIVGALETLGAEASKPLVVRLDGNAVEEGREILAAANHPLVTIVDTMDGAAAKATATSRRRGSITSC